MQTLPTFGYKEIVTEQIRGVLDTVADKPGVTAEHRAVLQQTTVCSVMAYNPRDPVEVMMSGQCIIYDAMLRDGARDLLRGQSELIKLRARPSFLAAGKMFLATQEALGRMQGRAADTLAFARQPETEPKAEPAPAATTTPMPVQPLDEVSTPEGVVECPPQMPIASIAAEAGALRPITSPPTEEASMPLAVSAISPVTAVRAARAQYATPEPACDGAATPDDQRVTPALAASACPAPTADAVPAEWAAELPKPPDFTWQPSAPTQPASHPAGSGRRQDAITAAERRNVALAATDPSELMSLATVEEILLNGLPPEEQQSIRDAVARTIRGGD